MRWRPYGKRLCRRLTLIDLLRYTRMYAGRYTREHIFIWFTLPKMSIFFNEIDSLSHRMASAYFEKIDLPNPRFNILAQTENQSIVSDFAKKNNLFSRNCTRQIDAVLMSSLQGAMHRSRHSTRQISHWPTNLWLRDNDTAIKKTQTIFYMKNVDDFFISCLNLCKAFNRNPLNFGSKWKKKSNIFLENSPQQDDK